jgi:hypothetical protein
MGDCSSAVPAAASIHPLYLCVYDQPEAKLVVVPHGFVED